MQRVKNLVSSTPFDRILNCDETTVKILPNNMLTWAEMGTDAISLIVEDDEKKMITAMATITAAGTKLPLFLIAKGKTKKPKKNNWATFHITCPFIQRMDGYLKKRSTIILGLFVSITMTMNPFF